MTHRQRWLMLGLGLAYLLSFLFCAEHRSTRCQEPHISQIEDC